MRKLKSLYFYWEGTVMKQPTVTSFFLGANSKDGFYSLYDYFAAAPDDTLHIIKSGPGTGKSTFMKRIGKAAEERGYDVEYILCSGDPDSLDGVYIPALHTGFVDGTSPHVLEPEFFGVSGDYINLGRFCDIARLAPHRQEIRRATLGYQQCYRKAYTYLSAAGTLQNSTAAFHPDSQTEQKIRKRAQAKIARELNGSTYTPSKPTKRFLRAISCKGNYILGRTLETLCSHLCVLESHYGLESLFFEEVIQTLLQQQVSCIICPNPLCPERVEAVLLPEHGLCFITAGTAPEFSGKVRVIHLDAYLEDAPKNEFKQREKLIQQLIDSAYVHLIQAKVLHDELETYYRPALDVDALNAYTEDVIQRLFA